MVWEKRRGPIVFSVEEWKQHLQAAIVVECTNGNEPDPLGESWIGIEESLRELEDTGKLGSNKPGTVVVKTETRY